MPEGTNTPSPSTSLRTKHEIVISRAGEDFCIVDIIRIPTEEPNNRATVLGKTAMEQTMAERRKTTRPRKTAARKSGRRTPAKKPSPKRWSQRVTKESDALDLKGGVFKQTSAKKIAASLKRSAERSKRRKSSPYRSAMSMLTFYINRAGKSLGARQRSVLERAKDELRKQFGRE